MDRRWGRRDRDLCVNVGAPIALSPKLLASSVARFFGKIKRKVRSKDAARDSLIVHHQ